MWIIVLCMQRICITSVLLQTIKYVNVVLGKSVDLVQLGSSAKDRPEVVEQAKYNNSNLNFPQKTL